MSRAIVIDVRLIGRSAEQQALREMLDSVRGGRSRSLVLRGEPGVGKSSLLDYAVTQAEDMQIVRMVAVESENHLGFAAASAMRRALDLGVDGIITNEPARLFGALLRRSGRRSLRSWWSSAVPAQRSATTGP